MILLYLNNKLTLVSLQGYNLTVFFYKIMKKIFKNYRLLVFFLIIIIFIILTIVRKQKMKIDKLSIENPNPFTMKKASSYIIPADFPDPDIIRVDDTYYMVSTTMHFMPGCVILRSHNLVD